MIWKESVNHHGKCYYYLINICQFIAKNKHKVIYPNLQSAHRSVPHDNKFPVPILPQDGTESIKNEMETETKPFSKSRLHS